MRGREHASCAAAHPTSIFTCRRYCGGPRCCSTCFGRLGQPIGSLFSFGAGPLFPSCCQVKNMKSPPEGVITVSKALCWMLLGSTNEQTDLAPYWWRALDLVAVWASVEFDMFWYEPNSVARFDVKPKKVTAEDGRTKARLPANVHARKSTWVYNTVFDRICDSQRQQLLESSYAIYHHASMYGFGRLMTIGSRQRRAFGGSGNPAAFRSFLEGWSRWVWLRTPRCWIDCLAGNPETLCVEMAHAVWSPYLKQQISVRFVAL